MKVIQHALLETLVISLFSAACTYAQTPEMLRTEAVKIHAEVITIDSHDDIPLNFATEAVDPLNATRQVTLENMRIGGLDAAFFVVYVGQTERTLANYEQAQADAMTKFNAIHRMTGEMYPELIELAYSANDIERIHASGKLVAAIGIENGYVIGTDLSLLERYHELGARYMTLAHSGHNDISDSAQPRPEFGDSESEHDGISQFGEQVITEMNRIGMIVDVSHISKEAALDAISLSNAPVIASHSNTRKLTDHYRNMDNETLLALKNNGGVIQTTALATFVKQQTTVQREQTREIFSNYGIGRISEWWDLTTQQRDEIKEDLLAIGYANVSDFIDHVDYAVDLIGIDHVGLSSDFDGGGGVVGWFDAGETFNVTLELVRRGYSTEDIRKLWGGNLIRVWREVERVAAESH
ncbi:MAG TPA: membrane dipeptidase [Nitrospirales bacterium]|nr:membrane dipeptidase [Nitrospirales bacterium]